MAEFCSRYAPPYPASNELRSWAQIQLLRPVGTPPIILVGSSQIQEGMDCAVFEARFPRRACANIAIAGASPLDTLYLANRVDGRTRRHTLVTGIFPQTLHLEPKASFTDLATLRCLYRTGTLSRMTPPEWIDDLLFAGVLSLSDTARLKDGLRDMWDVVGEDPMAALRHEIAPQPLSALDGRPPLEGAYFRRMIGEVDNRIRPGRFTPAHEDALETLIADEVKRGNQMIVIDFPTRSGYETTITPEAVEQHRRLVARLSARGGVYVVRKPELPRLVNADFRDFTHLRASGRQKVSECIAGILARIGG